MNTTRAPKMTPHARRQCESRSFPADVIEHVVDVKLAGGEYESAAIFVGRTPDRGSLVGSNGECVWAIIRDGEIVTVMLRRGNQPSTPGALRVRKVIGEARK
jgi:hypothetical protein